MFLDQHEEFNKVFLKMSLSDDFVGDSDEIVAEWDQALAEEEAEQMRELESLRGKEEKEAGSGQDSDDFVVLMNGDSIGLVESVAS